ALLLGHLELPHHGVREDFAGGEVPRERPALLDGTLELVELHLDAVLADGAAREAERLHHGDAVREEIAHGARELHERRAVEDLPEHREPEEEVVVAIPHAPELL